ncbi:MAG: hypothetical protein ABSG81_00900 [Acidimicrobiales bacterium]|jgi:hypothetical protein
MPESVVESAAAALEPVELSDDELTALALAADPDAPLDADAVPFDLYLATAAAPLPAWYMAPARARHLGRVSRMVVLGLVASFLIIEAFGLCSTYGQSLFH